MTRRSFLAWSSALGLATLAGRRARASGPKNLLVLWSAGGWDPTFVFDPHFGSDVLSNDPDSAAASAHGISFAAAETRPSVSRFFERYGDRAAVLNGLAVGSISHEGCTRLMLTGGRGVGRPDVGTAVASAAGEGLILPHLVLSGPRYPGALGALVVPLNATLGGVSSGALPAGVSVDAVATALMVSLPMRTAAAGIASACAATSRARARASPCGATWSTRPIAWAPPAARPWAPGGTGWPVFQI